LPIYFRNAAGAIAVYDVTNLDSFRHLAEWITLFTGVAGKNSIVVVAGNKCDSDVHAVSESLAIEWATSHDTRHFKTSAKTGAGIEELFHDFAHMLGESGFGRRTVTTPLDYRPGKTAGFCRC
jgi:Ras-related protein Rab-21